MEECHLKRHTYTSLHAWSTYSTAVIHGMYRCHSPNRCFSTSAANFSVNLASHDSQDSQNGYAIAPYWGIHRVRLEISSGRLSRDLTPSTTRPGALRMRQKLPLTSLIAVNWPTLSTVKRRRRCRARIAAIPEPEVLPTIIANDTCSGLAPVNYRAVLDERARDDQSTDN